MFCSFFPWVSGDPNRKGFFLSSRYSVILEGSQEQQILTSTTLNLTNLSWMSLLPANFFSSRIHPPSAPSVLHKLILSDDGRMPSIKRDPQIVSKAECSSKKRGTNVFWF